MATARFSKLSEEGEALSLQILGVAMLVANPPPIVTGAALTGSPNQISQGSDQVVPAPPTPPTARTDPAAQAGAGAKTPAVDRAASADPAQQSTDEEGVGDEILVTARKRSGSDPLEGVNVTSYKVVQAVDGALIAPIAKGYKSVAPKPVRKGIHNVLNNLQQPIIFLNYMLQLKPGKAAETFGRFAINTTVGVAGILDVAKRRPFNLPHRPNSLANTLGFYGVKPGPYLFLPLVGPTTLRDLFGISVDRLVLPMAVGKPFNQAYYTIPVNVLSALDYRVEFDDRLSKLHADKDPYAATRADYLRKRKAEIDRLHSPKWRARHSAPEPAGPVGTTAPEKGPPDSALRTDASGEAAMPESVGAAPTSISPVSETAPGPRRPS